jgi:hypothetical protein
VNYIPAYSWFDTTGYTVKTRDEAIYYYNESKSKLKGICSILDKPSYWGGTAEAYASEIVKNMFFSAAYLLSTVGTWDSEENDDTKAAKIMSDYLPKICRCSIQTPYPPHTAEMRRESDFCTKYQCPYCRELVPIGGLGTHIKSLCPQIDKTHLGKYPDANSFGHLYKLSLPELYEVFLSKENSLEPPSKKPRVKV